MSYDPSEYRWNDNQVDEILRREAEEAREDEREELLAKEFAFVETPACEEACFERVEHTERCQRKQPGRETRKGAVNGRRAGR